MNISAPFIKRPTATFLLAGAMFVAGAAAFTQLPVAPLPRVDFPTISVSASLPGASPQTMASAVATPLERRFGRIAGVTEMTSTSTLGTTSITMQFDLDRNVEAAARDVQAAINAAGGDLPPNLPFRPRYQKVNPADAPILIYSLRSKTLPLSDIFEAGNTIFAQKIAQVAGVGQVFVGGGQQPAVRVQADPAALASAGLTLEDVRGSLGTLTVDRPKGSISGAMTQQAIAANDQLVGAKAWSNAIVSYKSGAAVRLGDVAHVVDSVENERVAGWSDGERTVMLIVRRQPGANILEVIDRVKAVIPQLAHSISPAIDVHLTMDRAQTIRAAVADVEASLVISVALVVFVVFLFLRSVWATVIPSIAVPLSLVATFGVMYLCGYSVDNLSLMALTISTGFVVDDAIVVTENVTRFVEAGVPPEEAALRGAKQIGFTIVSITASLLAVFIPILLMGGIVGRLFREFAVTLAIAIGVSAVISLTLTPTMCARMLAHKKEEQPGRFERWLEAGFQSVQNGYGRGLRFVLRHRFVVGLVTFGTVALTVWLYVIVPKGLFPQQDTGLLSGFTDAPQDISFPAMKERQYAVEKVVEEDPDVAHVISFIGGGGGGTLNTGTMFIALKPKEQRKSSADEIINRLRPKLARVSGIQLFLQAVQDVRMGGRPARTQYQYTMQDANLEELLQWGPRMVAALRKLPELKDVNSDQQTAGLEIVADVDRDTAARLGVSMRDVDNTLYDAFGQRQVATTFTQLNQYRVVLEILPELGRHPAAINSLYVRSASGAPVPLSALVTLHEDAVPLSVNHQGQFPSVTLSFNGAPGVALGDAVAAIHRAERDAGTPASIHADFSGTAQAYKDSLASEPMLILAALLTVYIVLGMLYESYIHPITILSTLPSAGVGALLALMLFHVELSVIGLVGIILLIGIVKKNAILMIDFALEAERDHGMTPEQAIYQACLLRFRPIMMTTMAALLGGLPLALGGGSGSELRRPLGIAIVGGLLLSQILTLFTTPVIYLALDRFRRRPHATVVAPS
ncbi:MAG: Cobalt-zinc-cadmium resistance protein CzcA [Myxococcales bacterium]|nr:Cobalt-zinc-cadmium resistance protein CzcA [Myxococcales bacterium]